MDGETVRTDRRALRWVAAGMAAVALVVAAVAGALRDPAPLDPATPEGVVQAYLRAVLAGEHAEAADSLSQATARRCGPSAFRSAGVPDPMSAALDDVRREGDQARVRVRLRATAGPPPFGGGDYSALETFTLEREGGQWRLTGEPWPLLNCREAS